MSMRKTVTHNSGKHYQQKFSSCWCVCLLNSLEVLRLCQLTFPSIPCMPAAASSIVAYLTNPNPFEKPDARSVTTLAAKGKGKMFYENGKCMP